MPDPATPNVHPKGTHWPGRIMRTSMRVAHLLGLARRAHHSATQPSVAPALQIPKSQARIVTRRSVGSKRHNAHARKPRPDYSALAQLATSKMASPSQTKAETRASWDLAFRRARLGPAALASWTNSVPSKRQSENDRSWDDAFRKAARR